MVEIVWNEIVRPERMENIEAVDLGWATPRLPVLRIATASLSGRYVEISIVTKHPDPLTLHSVRVLAMVGELHKRGCQNLRVMPYFGITWRLALLDWPRPILFLLQSRPGGP
jgi:hypothetical protein